MSDDTIASVMQKNCRDNLPIVVRNGRDTTNKRVKEEQQLAIQQKDFKTRLFISSFIIENMSVWIRTHYSDCSNVSRYQDDDNGDSVFQHVKECFEASYTNKDHMVAKAALTKLLGKVYEFDNKEYYAFATILASGLSQKGSHVSFQVGNANAANAANGPDANAGLVKDAKDLTIARMRFTLLMDIVFRRISVKRFLLDDDFCNIFRLVHCESKGNRNKWTLLYVIFSFLLQGCLAVFCVTEVWSEIQGDNFANTQLGMYVLAALGSTFCFIAQLPEFRNTKKVFNFYGKVGFLQMIDFSVNVILPIVIIIVGFFLVSSQDNFVDAVIMTTALLFIPEIDDKLPALLGFDPEAVIETYLIGESKLAYNHYQKLNDATIGRMANSISSSTRSLVHSDNDRHGHSDDLGVEFSDYFITNSEEAGPLNLFSVMFNADGGHEIAPANFISDDCLIQTVQWSFTRENEDSLKPTISWLRLVKLNGEVIEKDYRSNSNDNGKVNDNGNDGGRVHRLDGVFVITGIEMGCSDIHCLRVCGSQNAHDFLKAMTYYSLWEVRGDAQSTLRNTKTNAKIKQKSSDVSSFEMGAMTTGVYHSMV